MRRVAASVVAVSALTLTSACSMFNPVQTNVPYVQADGVPADIGKLALRDLALVSSGSGEMVLSGSAVNNGSDELTVRLTPQSAAGAAPSGGSELSLKPHEQVNLATKGVQFSDAPGKPGSLVPVSVTSSAGGTTVVRVPILTPSGAYATLTPAPAPAPASTETSTVPTVPTPTETTSATSAG
jgi:hypothetical protein